MEFTKTPLVEEFNIGHIVTLHYFEFARDFVFEGEKHDFWEFLYVDKGEVEVMADSKGYVLKQGDIIFHKPNEFHSVWANKKTAPDLIVITFPCDSPSMKLFENKIFNLEDSERNILAEIIREGTEAFLPPLDMPSINTLSKNQLSSFGSEQLVKIYIELLLIKLVRRGKHLPGKSRLSSSAKERSEDEVIRRIIDYMQENIYSFLSLDELCRFSQMGRSHLSTMFKQKVGYGAVEYFRKMKIDLAKKLIREEQLNFTEIAEKLGYSSIHCFSRHFKSVEDVSPTEYARSVKSRVL